MDPYWLILVLLIPGIPLFIQGLRSGQALSFVLPFMFLYGLVSIHFARVASKDTQLWLLLVAGISIGFGWFLVWLMGSTLTGRSRRLFEFQPRNSRIWVLAIVGFGTSVFLFATNGVPILSGTSMTSRLDILSNGYLGTLAIAPLNALLIIFLCRVDFSRRRQSLANLSLALVTFGCLWLFANRGLAVFPLLAVGAYFLIKYPKYIGHVVVAAAAILLLVGYAGYVRNHEAWGGAYDRDLAALGYTGPLRYLAPVVQYTVGTSEATDIVLRIFPSLESHPGGMVFFSALLAPLPGNQPTAGMFLKETVGLEFEGAGLAMGAISGLYMDFGLLGVVFGFALCGMLIAAFDYRSYSDPRWTLILAWFAGHLVLMNYSHPIPNFAAMLVPVLIFWSTSPGDRSTRTIQKSPRLAKAASNRIASRRLFHIPRIAEN